MEGNLSLVGYGLATIGPAIAVGLIFAAVWTGILLMARDVRRRYARGELPAQVAAREAARRSADGEPLEQ